MSSASVSTRDEKSFIASRYSADATSTRRPGASKYRTALGSGPCRKPLTASFNQSGSSPQCDRGPADEKNLRPLPNCIEFRCKFSEQPADVVGGERASSHTRLRAPAVMKIPLVRKDGGDS